MQIFKNDEFGAIRTVVRKDEPWFVGKDVSQALGYKDTVNALKSHVDVEDKRGWQIATPSGRQQMTIINESGMYSLILSSLLESDAAAYLPGIPFDRMIDREQFNIIVQSGFSDSGDKDKVLAAIGNMRLENSVQVQDDGVTQTVASKSGVVVVEKKNIPNPVTLSPYRTFAEIMQPASRFILRVNEDGNVGLFEADGGAWRNEAIRLINDYLFIKLNGDYFTIIA